MDDKINYQLPEAVVTEVTEKLNEVIALLAPYMIALTPEERQGLPKMGDGTAPFVQKCMEYCKTSPQFAPTYLNVTEFTNDLDVWTKLISVFRLISQLYSNTDDTTMQAGSESYGAALIYYNSVKQAAKDDVPGAKTIYEDLKQRFTYTSSKKKTGTDA